MKESCDCEWQGSRWIIITRRNA